MSEVQSSRCLVLGLALKYDAWSPATATEDPESPLDFMSDLSPRRDGLSSLAHLRCRCACAQATALSSQWSSIRAREKAELTAPFLPLADSLHKLGRIVFLLRASSKPSRNQFNIISVTLFLRLL